MALRRRTGVILATVVVLAAPEAALGSEGSDVFTRDTMLLVVLITAAAWSGFLFEKLGLPELVGEIFAGIVLGNLALIGLDLNVTEQLRSSEFLRYGAELGVVLLLFVVGLESNLGELLRVGRNASLVAATGVILPLVFGIGASLLFGFAAGLAAWFIGATLTATSVGITAKSLDESSMLHTPSAKVILGAAVIDDVLGILLLAILASIATTGELSATSIGWIILKAIGFFVAAILVGKYVLPTAVRITSVNPHASFWTGFAFCTALGSAQLAAMAGLAPIIGAFVGGLLLDDVHFTDGNALQKRKLEELLKPTVGLMMTIFFVSIGTQVDLRTVAEPAAVGAILVLLTVAIVTKGLAGLAVTGNDFDRLGIGAGMVPRGEVGLIFASFALGHHVFDEQTYSIMVMVVLLSTIAGPILMKPRLAHFEPADKRARGRAGALPG